MYNFVFIVSLLKTPYKFYIMQPYGRYCVNSQHNILIQLYALLTTFFCLTLRHHGKLFSASIISVYAGSSFLYIYLPTTPIYPPPPPLLCYELESSIPCFFFLNVFSICTLLP